MIKVNPIWATNVEEWETLNKWHRWLSEFLRRLVTNSEGRLAACPRQKTTSQDKTSRKGACLLTALTAGSWGKDEIALGASDSVSGPDAFVHVVHGRPQDLKFACTVRQFLRHLQMRKACNSNISSSPRIRMPHTLQAKSLKETRFIALLTTVVSARSYEPAEAVDRPAHNVQSVSQQNSHPRAHKTSTVTLLVFTAVLECRARLRWVTFDFNQAFLFLHHAGILGFFLLVRRSLTAVAPQHRLPPVRATAAQTTWKLTPKRPTRHHSRETSMCRTKSSRIS